MLHSLSRSERLCPINAVLQKQGAISHSSAEAEIIALEAAVRMEGLPLLYLWEQVIVVFHPGPIEQPTVKQAETLRTVTEFLRSVDHVDTIIFPYAGLGNLRLMEDT